MASQSSTPKLVYARLNNKKGNGSCCRLCNSETEARHLLKIYSKSGVHKALQRKVSRTCGIDLSQNDGLPETICRKCENFVEKMWTFRQVCQKIQLELRQSFQIKRCLIMSPSFKQEQKRVAVEKHQVSPRKQLSFGPLKNITNNFQNDKVNIMSNILTNRSTPIVPSTIISVYNKDFNKIVNTPLNADQYRNMTNSINTKMPVEISNCIQKECPSVALALKQTLLEELKQSVNKLCRRKESSSVLLNNSFTGMSEFKFDSIWQEIKNNHQLLLDVFNTITGNQNDFDETKQNLKIKYSFLYSILMNCRWHELSLLQRINTMLIIEGGCSKQV